MIVKVGDEYLDFAGEVEMERQAKLFSNLQTTNGDFSYSFNLDRTGKNLKALGIPLPDVKNKTIYNKINAQLLSKEGAVLYDGYLKVEDVNNVIAVSFFSGNNNWFALLSGNLEDIDLSQYDEDMTTTTISDSWSRTSGIIYHLVDLGAIQTRSHAVFTVPDFAPSMFVHTAMTEVFKSAGLKIAGDLISDVDYNKATITSTRIDENEIAIRTVYAHKLVNQVIPSSVDTQVTFPDVSAPYFDATNGNYAGSMYTADVDMVLTVQFRIIQSLSALNFIWLRIIINSNVYQEYTSRRIYLNIDEVDIRMKAGDVLEIQHYSDIGTHTIIAGSTIKIIPTRVFVTNGGIVLPNWTKQKFVSNILRLYNVIPRYDSFSKTVYFDLFENIKTKPYIDLSPYVVSQEFNYTDLISDYAQLNLLTYNESGITELEDYNKTNSRPYSSGVISVDNDHIDKETTIIESDFTAPYGYINAVFDMHFEKLTINDLESLSSIDIEQVDDFSGTAQFKMGIANHRVRVGDIVRITKSTNTAYNGEWVVSYSFDDNVRLFNVDYEGDANLTIEIMVIKRSNTDDAFILLNSSYMAISEFTDATEINIYTTTNNTYTSASFAYFNLLNTNRNVNDSLTTGLSFGEIANRDSYQKTLVETRFKLFGLILQDPVKCINVMSLPSHIFRKIDFTQPIFITTDKTSNLYYGNKISGYKGSHKTCVVELIKLP